MLRLLVQGPQSGNRRLEKHPHITDAKTRDRDESKVSQLLGAAPAKRTSVSSLRVSLKYILHAFLPLAPQLRYRVLISSHHHHHYPEMRFLKVKGRNR